MKTYNFGVKSAAWAASLAARGFSVVDRGERPVYPEKGHEKKRFAVAVPGQTRRQAKRRFNALYWEAFAYVNTVDKGCGCCLRTIYKMRPKCGGTPLATCSGENPLVGTELREERGYCFNAEHALEMCGGCDGSGWATYEKREIANPCPWGMLYSTLPKRCGEYTQTPRTSK